MLFTVWPEANSAVAAIPDPRKGERLVLVTERKDATRAAFQGFARSKGASEMMAPAEVVIVDRLPLLGSGKVDGRAVATIVEKREAA